MASDVTADFMCESVLACAGRSVETRAITPQCCGGRPAVNACPFGTIASRPLRRNREARGLTRNPRQLYSARFGALVSARAPSPCGGIGRRARLKIEFRKECWFDSGQGHQERVRPRPLTSNLASNNGPERRFDV